MTSPTDSDYTYESESEFDLLLRDARGRVPRDGALTSPRVQQAYTPLHYTTRTMSNPAGVGQPTSPAGVGQPTGNPNLIDQAMALSGITVSALPPLTPTSPAGVGSASNQPISDLYDAQAEEEEEAAREAARRRQQRRIQAPRGKRPAARGRPSVSGTTTTTTRLPARRPRRPVQPPTPPPPPHRVVRRPPAEVEVEVAFLLSRQDAPSPPHRQAARPPSERLPRPPMKGTCNKCFNF